MLVLEFRAFRPRHFRAVSKDSETRYTSKFSQKFARHSSTSCYRARRPGPHTTGPRETRCSGCRRKATAKRSVSPYDFKTPRLRREIKGEFPSCHSAIHPLRCCFRTASRSRKTRGKAPPAETEPGAQVRKPPARERPAVQVAAGKPLS